ncbi:PAS domain-containing protein [Hyphobacterium sp. HN65]|uniref:PAS domain-containing protein n=1 Tax=Hyphobacterium lacteum TaxID=3116575 RepID=A0ABU7LTK9_9PROT|nr:PAS domain-containing protein [Hyphobacterium sp. HN65]MEE2527252.1 PAS domain-containing protein [Hyphobacterium sp. HN65]
MLHSHSRTLVSYWDSRRREASVPARADIAAGELKAILGNLFMLQRHDPSHHVFRLAGTRLCDLHNRELRDQNFLSLWRGYDRAQMKLLLESVLANRAPAHAYATAETLNGDKIEVEMVFTPLASRAGQVDRILGLYQPLQSPDRFRKKPVIRHDLTRITLPVTRNWALPETPPPPVPDPANDA